MQAGEEQTKGADFGKAKNVFDVRKLEAEGKQGNGKAQIRPLRPSASVGIPSALADVREAKAGCCGRCSRSGCLAGEGVSK